MKLINLKFGVFASTFFILLPVEISIYNFSKDYASTTNTPRYQKQKRKGNSQAREAIFLISFKSLLTKIKLNGQCTISLITTCVTALGHVKFKLALAQCSAT